MSEPFDPYYTWLGIPPEEQPPNHYRLLGIKPLEGNLDVISNAVDQRMRHVRTYQTGKFADQSQEILNKISTARVCLLNAATKATYDAELQASLAAKEAPAAASAARPAAPRTPPQRALPVATPLDAAPRQSAAVSTVVPPVRDPHGAMELQPLVPSMAPGAIPGYAPLAGSAPRQSMPVWLMAAIGGGGALLLLLLAIVALPMMFSSPENPTVVRPDGDPPSPLPRQGRDTSPSRLANPFVAVSNQPGGTESAMNVRRGASDDPQATVGMIGLLNNQHLIRYQPGELLNPIVFAALRASYRISSPLRLELIGYASITEPGPYRFDVTRQTGPGPGVSRLDIARLVNNAPQVQHNSPPHPQTSTHVFHLQPGLHEVRWRLDAVDAGAWKLELKGPSQEPLELVYSVEDLDQRRQQHRGGEELHFLAGRSLAIVADGGGFRTEDAQARLRNRAPSGVAGGSTTPLTRMGSGAVAGPDDDATATHGFLGRVEVSGRDAGLLVRLRPGAQLPASLWQELASRYQLPQGTLRLQLQGNIDATVEVPLQMNYSGGPQTLVRPSIRGPRGSVANLLPSGRGGAQQSSTSRLLQGTSRVTVEVSGNDFGNARFAATEAPTGAPAVVYYTSADLTSARAMPTQAEVVVLPDRVLYRDGNRLVATSPAATVAGAPQGEDAPVLGNFEDLAVTSGLIGRLLIDGEDVGVVFRYRPGAVMTAAWSENISRQLNLPAGRPELALTGTLDPNRPGRPAQFGTSTILRVEGGARQGGTVTLVSDNSTLVQLGGSNFSTSERRHHFLRAAQPITWTIKDAPQGRCLFDPLHTDNSPCLIYYSTKTLNENRRFPLKAEVLITPRNTHIVRFSGGRSTGTTVIPTDPSAGGPTVVAPPPGEAIEVAGVPKREALPSDEKLKEASDLLNDVFGTEITAAKSSQERTTLARKLLQSARETNDDAATRYVLLNKARELGAAGGDLSLMSSAIDELDAGFEVDALKLKASGYFQLGRANPAGADWPALTREVIDLVDEGVQDDRFDVATTLADMALDFARRTKDTRVIKSATDKKRDVLAFKRQFEAIDAAQKVLAATPDDPEANFTVGRYRAMVKGEWAEGVPHLAKGPNADWAAAAKLDQAGGAAADEQVKIGDAWWTLADKAAEEDKLPLKLRAHHWYQQAQPELAGIAKIKVEQRVAEVDAEARRLAERNATGGAGGRAQPGWIVRAFDGPPLSARPSPTHVVAVIATSDELNQWVHPAAQREFDKRGLSISTYYLCVGYISLQADAIVTLEGTYADVAVDRTQVMRSSFVARTQALPLKRGIHEVTVVCRPSYNIRFRIYDAQGKDVVQYDPKMLQTQLAVEVRGPGGASVKSLLLDQNAP